MSWEQFCLWTNLQNFPIHVIRALDIDVFLYPTLTIEASSRLKRSDNHLWNNSDVCRKKFGEWSLLMLYFCYTIVDTTQRKKVFPEFPDWVCLQVKYIIYLTCLYSLRAISSLLAFFRTLFVVNIVIFRGMFWSNFLFGIQII